MMHRFRLFPLAACTSLTLLAAGCGQNAAEADASASGLEGTPDAAPGAKDAAPGTDDASPGTNDAAPGPDDAGQSNDPCAFAHDETLDVTSASELSDALSQAAPGTMIRLAAGTYKDRFGLKTSGKEDKPIVVCGPREAVLDGGSTSTGYGFHLEADHVILSGFSVTNSQKGIVLDGASHDLIKGVAVFKIGAEAIHFRKFSSDNTLEASEVRDTGEVEPGFGEAVYIGSAKSNWGSLTGGEPDKCDRNKVLGNKLGPNVAAELIDVKEGTTGAEIANNTFDGAGQTGENSADSWVDVKGSGNLIHDNKGKDPLKDAFQTHVQVDGWGNDNLFEKNVVALKSGSGGVGFWVHSKSTGNVVACDNQVSGGDLANIACK
jgi:hypothetical protein